MAFRIQDVKTDLKDMKASVVIRDEGLKHLGPHIMIGNLDIQSIGDVKASEVDAAVGELARRLLMEATSAY